MRRDSPECFPPGSVCMTTTCLEDWRCSMRKGQQIGRRTWLAQVALGSFAVWSELNFGLGRRGWGVAIGGRDLATGIAHAQSLGPAETLRVNLGFVNAYVVIRGKEEAVVETGTPNKSSKNNSVVRSR